MTLFTFRLGGRIAVFMEAYAGDAAEVVSAAASIRRLNHDRSDYLDEAPSIALQAQFQAAAGDQPAGWHFSLEEAASPQFSAGFYGIDAWLEDADGEVPTQMVVVQIRKAAGS